MAVPGPAGPGCSHQEAGKQLSARDQVVEAMQTPLLTKRVPGEPRLGEKASFRRTLTEADVALFIGVTWDVNPLHTDDIYAAGMPFKRRIVPGLLTASLLTHLGGLWAFMATDMHFQFLGPVFINETLTAQAEVVDFDPARRMVVLRCSCTNQDGQEVLRGEVTGFPGRFEG